MPEFSPRREDENPGNQGVSRPSQAILYPLGWEKSRKIFARQSLAQRSDRGESVVSVQIFVEGGGDHRDTLTACRRGFAKFFKNAFPAKNQPRIIACGSREVTFDKFKTALTDRVLPARLHESARLIR